MAYLTNLKALVVVLTLAVLVFGIAKPLCLRFMAESDYARRRNVWLVLTACAFISPSFWLYLLVAVGLILWSVRRDSNPVALYLLYMQLIPPSIKLSIPVIGINALFDMDMYRILAFSVLLPVLLSQRQQPRPARDASPKSMGVLLVAFGVLTLVLYVPYESLTNTLRRGVLFCLDSLLVYFAFSRACRTRNALIDVLATFCLAGALYAPLAVFETLKEWQLYREIGAVWGSPQLFPYLFREGVLRAFVSAGHALSLGYLMAVAFGFWLYLGGRLRSNAALIWGAIWMWMGLLATYSRAPWLVAVAIFGSYSLLSPKGVRQFVKVAMVCTVLTIPLVFSPLGGRVIDNLPFVGTVDKQNVEYREQLAHASWEVIKTNPFFGDRFFILRLEDMRQGQGIIDLVNSYATIAMQYGVVGLSLLLLPFLIGMYGIWAASRRAAAIQPDFAAMGACLIACMVGTLGMMATGGFGHGLAQMYYVLAGLAAAYVSIRPQEAPYARPLAHTAASGPGSTRSPMQA